MGSLRTGYGSLGRVVSEVEANATLGLVSGYLKKPASKEPATCGDGRRSKGLLSGKGPRLRYKMLGGDLQVNWEAQELAGGFMLGTIKHEQPDASPIERARGFMEKVMIRAYKRPGGAHTSSAHAHGPNSGCGAIDNHTAAMETIVREHDNGSDELISLTAAAMSEEFDAEFHESVVVPNAKRLAAEERRTEYNGSAFLDVLRTPSPKGKVLEKIGAKSIEDLEGDHDEELFVINLTDFTLDRDKFVGDTGKQVFWIDEPAIRRETARYAKDETEVRYLYQAAMTAQVAKAKTLSKSGMRIAILRLAA